MKVLQFLQYFVVLSVPFTNFRCKCAIYKFLRCYMLWVCENIFTVPLSTTDPCSITATRSHIRWMTFISCVINKIVIPISSLIFNNRSRIESVVSDLKHSLLHHLITLQVHVIAHEQLRHAVFDHRKFAWIRIFSIKKIDNA